MSEVPNELILEHLKRIHAQVNGLETMRHEMREGFAMVRQRNTSIDSDLIVFEKRINHMEEDIDRIKKRLDLLDE